MRALCITSRRILESACTISVRGRLLLEYLLAVCVCLPAYAHSGCKQVNLPITELDMQIRASFTSAERRSRSRFYLSITVQHPACLLYLHTLIYPHIPLDSLVYCVAQFRFHRSQLKRVVTITKACRGTNLSCCSRPIPFPSPRRWGLKLLVYAALSY